MNELYMVWCFDVSKHLFLVTYLKHQWLKTLFPTIRPHGCAIAGCTYIHLCVYVTCYNIIRMYNNNCDSVVHSSCIVYICITVMTILSSTIFTFTNYCSIQTFSTWVDIKQLMMYVATSILLKGECMGIVMVRNIKKYCMLVILYAY